jgi:hypothetical protein
MTNRELTKKLIELHERAYSDLLTVEIDFDEAHAAQDVSEINEAYIDSAIRSLQQIKTLMQNA